MLNPSLNLDGQKGWIRVLGLFRCIKFPNTLKIFTGIINALKKHHFENVPKSDLVSKLRYVTLKRKQRQIDFRDTAQRLDIKYTKGDKVNKVAKKLITDGLSNNVPMSIKTIGNIWGMSTTTGHRFKKRWEAEGNINVTTQPPKLYQSHVSGDGYKMFKQTPEYNQTFFYCNGNIWQSQSDKIYCYV